MLSSIRNALTAVLSGLVAVFGLAAYWYRSQSKTAEKKAVRATERAEGEKAARDHVQSTTEVNREIEDDMRSTTADQRRRELREYTPDDGD